jgi:hypothetical protein
MQIKLSHVTPLLAAGAVAAAIAAAPTAAAADMQSCTSSGSKHCQSPGNVQINDSTAVGQVGPYGPLYNGYARGRD